MRECGVGIFSSRIPSMKPTITSSITETFKGKDGTLLSLSLNIHRVFLSPAGGGGWTVGRRSGRCSVYVLYICHCLDEWHGLVCFPPLLLIICVLFPLCCTIRTLQWDTDPSVLQLQSDSELGYMSALSLLLLLFLCCSCVRMLALLLLLCFPPFVELPVWEVYFLLLAFRIKLSFEESLSLWKTPQKDGFWSPLLHFYDCKTTRSRNKKYKHMPTPLLQGGAHKFCDGRDDGLYANCLSLLLISCLRLIFV